MTSQTPTDEQVIEFWEWAGFKKELCNNKNLPQFYFIPNCESMYYNRDSKLSVLPDITLGNLFQWGIPKKWFVEIRHSPNLKITSVKITVEDQHTYYHDTNPALALFWALWETKETIK